ncbi:MAG: carbohydrate ABC transporter substrate-binding protein [Pseudomonadota bacterium]
MAEIHLRGMTWDHARGFDPMVATAAHYAKNHPNVRISWEKRSLQAFADRPIEDMANIYDLMVIDHPHVGDIAHRQANAPLLLALDTVGRERELAHLASQSVGASHPSYHFGDHQWALAIDAATPVAAYRSDLLASAPQIWDEVIELARAGHVAIPLIPLNALMTFYGLARNQSFAIAQDDRLIDREEGRKVFADLRALTAHLDPRCYTLDPIGVYDWMANNKNAPAYCPFAYGYSNYARKGGYPFALSFIDAPGVNNADPKGTVLGGTGIAISAHCAHREVAVDYAFWIAGADCQKGLFFDAGGQPGHAAAWDDEACNAACGRFFYQTRKTLETAWLRPRYRGYMQLQDRGGDIVFAALQDHITVDQALDQLDAAYQESRS